VTSASKIRIDRSGDASGAAADMDANAYTAGDTIVMPQHHGPLDRGRGQELLAHELVHVGQQRRLGSSLPAEHTGAGQQLEREAQSAESLVSRTRGTPALDMPLARTSPQRSTADGHSSHSSEVDQATQLALAAGPRASSSDSIEVPAAAHASPAHGDPAQRSARSSASSASLSSAAADGGGSPAAAAKPADDEELEELARKLYERLRLRLKRELLLDRERGGFLADSR
jgi:hypothetical protein